MVRSSWFDGLTMRILLVAVATATLFAHTAPLADDAAPADVFVGPIVIHVPGDWMVLMMNFMNSSVLLHVPPKALDGVRGISTDGIEGMGIYFAHTEAGTEYETNVEKPLADAALRLGPAMPQEAAIAFDDIPFDRLYGSFTANAGKSITRPLIMVGSIEYAEYGSILVTASLEHADTPTPDRQYTIVALFDLQGAQFLIRIMLGTSRPLRAADLGIIDAVVRVLTESAPH